MKKGIHPMWHNNAKITSNGKVIMTAGSTKEELTVEIWSGNHPFYTGQEMLVDTDNLVEKFNQKLESSKKLKVSARNKREKRNRRKQSESAGQAVTLKDMLNNIK